MTRVETPEGWAARQPIIDPWSPQTGWLGFAPSAITEVWMAPQAYRVAGICERQYVAQSIPACMAVYSAVVLPSASAGSVDNT